GGSSPGPEDDSGAGVLSTGSVPSAGLRTGGWPAEATSDEPRAVSGRGASTGMARSSKGGGTGSGGDRGTRGRGRKRGPGRGGCANGVPDAAVRRADVVPRARRSG